MTVRRIRGDLNAVVVTAGELFLAAGELRGLASPDKDWSGTLSVLTRLFKGDPYKGLATQCRLIAIARLLEGGELQGWIAKSTGRSSQVAEVIWIAAAAEPLVLDAVGAHFEQAHFFHRIMLLAAPRGIGWAVHRERRASALGYCRVH